MTAISWKRYDDEFHLSEVLTEAARACVDAKAANPTEFLTSYFRSVSKGDVVQETFCEPLFAMSPEAEGMRFGLKLFTNIEATAEAVPLSAPSVPRRSSDADAAQHGAREVELMMLADFVTTELQRRLLPIGVHRLADWDAVLHEHGAAAGGSALRAASTPKLPATLQHAMSVAAATAAAKTLAVPLHVALRSFRLTAPQYTLQPNAVRAMSANGEEHFAAPQLVLPFFGRAGTVGGDSGKASAVASAAAASGGVHLDTLYVLPRRSALDRADGDGSQRLPRLLQAFRALQARVASLASPGTSASGVPSAAIRPDGAVVADDFDNLVDAVELAAEVVRSVGLEPGTDVHFGLRLACPAIIAPSFGQNQANADASTTTGSHTTSGDGKEASGKKAGTAAAGKKAAAGGKQAAPQAEDIMYTLFSGDGDVTSSQLSAYICQQVMACEGQIALLQDVHVAEDVEGAQRLQALLGPSVCVSVRTPFEAARLSDYERVCQQAHKEKWAADVCLSPMHMGTLSTLFDTVTYAQKLGRSVTLFALAGSRGRAQEAVVDMALALMARHVVLGGLASAGGAQAVAHYLSVVDTLQQQRSLTELPPGSAFYPENLPSADISGVPEIKRKADKKKRKTR